MAWTQVALFLLLFTRVSSQPPYPCTPSIAFSSDSTLGPDDCSGYLSIGANRICGNFDNDAARRACWERGLNLDTGTGRRQYRCRVADPANVNGISTNDMVHPITEGTIGEACDAGSPNCFAECHAAAGAALPATAGLSECGLNPKDAAISCDDVDECLEGVLRNCQGPFDKECSRDKACAPNADCTNNMGGYRCDCKAGYDGTPYSQSGCQDIDECDSPAGNCGLDMCQNTPGSFVCLCRDGYSWDPVAEDCEIDTCGTLPGIADSMPVAYSDASRQYETTGTYTCNSGYMPSITADSDITTTCRGDGTWCNCASLTCQRVRCGIPPTDGNAFTLMTSGVFNDQLMYTCLPGFSADNAQSYHLDCEADGDWSTPSARCTDDDDCLDVNKCPDNSMCYNTAGSYICICDPGYTSSPGDCTKISCGPIPDVVNGQRTTHSGVADGFFGMVVSYRCEDGYTASIGKSPHQIIQSFDIECKLDECWSPLPIPKCIPVSCGDPGTLPYATRYGATFYYQDDVSYTCVDGFRPSDYSTAGSSTHKTFVITCGKNGDWSERPFCVDINECLELDLPCGPGDGHYCINKKGGYTCSCAPYYRLDNTGTTCIGIPANAKDIDKPCEFYQTLNFCNYGECFYDGGVVPRCRCNTGYKGAFCDVPDEFEFSLTFILAVAALILCAFTLIMCIVLACYVCSRHHHLNPPNNNSPTYAAPLTAPAVRYRKPRILPFRSPFRL